MVKGKPEPEVLLLTGFEAPLKVCFDGAGAGKNKKKPK
jgi:hypothetical protein